jgi:23S rRNA (uracil1939-C5)-methyltransferase
MKPRRPQPSAPRKNATPVAPSTIETPLLIEKPVYGGDCLAHLPGNPGTIPGTHKSGKAVFVPLTLPGEQVIARVSDQKRGFDRAEIATIVTPSPDRVPPPCPYYGVCGGCQYQHAAYPAQLALKQQILRETLTRAGVTIPAEFDPLSPDPTDSTGPWAYRNRIRLAVTSERVGYRGRRSNEIIPIVECPIAAPSLIETALAAAPYLRQCPAVISEMELFTNSAQSELLITLFCEQPPASDPQPWIEKLAGALPQASGIMLRETSLPDPQLVASTGASSLTYTAAGLAYESPAAAFFQVNRHILDRFVALVIDSASAVPTGSAWDLYAGVGLFARQLASRFAHVTAVESAPACHPALEHNLAGTSAVAVQATTLDFLHRNREERLGRPDLIVLDPPRSGLGDEVTTLLAAIHAPALVYVSCDPSTLARDLRALTSERYRIDAVTLVDMFPQTFHLETVVRLLRV